MGERQGTCLHHHTLIKELVTIKLNGEERQVYHYAGCEKCPSTWDKKPLFEMDVRGKRKYPYHNPSLSLNQSFSGVAENLMSEKMKDIETRLKTLRNNDCQAQELDIEELKQNIIEIEKHCSSLKSKLEMSKEPSDRTAENDSGTDDSCSTGGEKSSSEEEI